MGNIDQMTDAHYPLGQSEDFTIKNKKIRRRVAYLISILPMNSIRVYLYRTLFGYHVYKSHIGKRTVIDVEHVEITECRIAGNNQFLGPMRLKVEKGALIEGGNSFLCMGFTAKEKYRKLNFQRHFELGKNCRLASDHFFDVAGSIIFEDECLIAGRGSQFWTHGAGVVDRNIHVGKNCYIASAVRFAPGASIGNRCIVGLGSVVTRKFDEDNLLVAGNPAKIVRRNYREQKSKEMNL